MSESLRVLHMHYQDTVGHLKDKEKERRFYLAVSAALTLIAVADTMSVGTGGSLFLIALKAATGQKDLALSAPVLTIGLLFGTAVYAQLYFQADVWIERTYRYAHALEAELCKVEGLTSIAFESHAYTVNYPLFSWWTYVFYKFLVPLFLIFGVLVVPFRALEEGETGIGALALLWVASAMTFISASLYLGFIVFGNKALDRSQ